MRHTLECCAESGRYPREPGEVPALALWERDAEDRSRSLKFSIKKTNQKCCESYHFERLLFSKNKQSARAEAAAFV